MSKIPRLPGDGAQADPESNFDESTKTPATTVNAQQNADSENAASTAATDAEHLEGNEKRMLSSIMGAVQIYF